MSLSRKLLLSECSPYVRNEIMSNVRSMWVHQYYTDRQCDGEYLRVYKKIRSYPDQFYKYARMSIETFDILLHKVKDTLERTSTNFREAISAEQRLILTISYLAHGDSFASLATRFKMGKTTVSEIVIDTCLVLWNVLKEEYLPVPTEEGWHSIAQRFYEKWNFPNCIGSLDGKHIRVKAPSHSGSRYYNYKQFFSILLQAVVDPDYKLIAIDVGTPGRESDSGNFRTSSLFHALEADSLKIPSDKNLPFSNIQAPFVLLADEGFPLLPYLMRPYPVKNLTNENRIFNYRLSRARNTVECAFGIMASKWRILNKCIETNAHHATDIVKAVCILHNYVITHEKKDPVVQGQAIQRCQMPNDMRPVNHRFINRAMATRNIFRDYFNGVGAVPWQDDYALPENIIRREEATPE